MRAQYLLTIAVPENLKETVRSSSSCAEAIRELANRFEKKSEIESEVYKSLEAIPVLSNRPSVDEWKRYRDTILSTQRRATPFGDVMLNKVHTALSYGKLGPFYFQYMNRKHRETLPDLLKFTEDKIAMLEQKPSTVPSQCPLATTIASLVNLPQLLPSIATHKLSHVLSAPSRT